MSRGTAHFVMRLDPAVQSQLRAAAARLGTNVSDLVRGFIDTGLYHLDPLTVKPDARPATTDGAAAPSSPTRGPAAPPREARDGRTPAPPRPSRARTPEPLTPQRAEKKTQARHPRGPGKMAENARKGLDFFGRPDYCLVTCPSCGEGPGICCKSKSGRGTVTHERRMDAWSRVYGITDREA